MKQPITWVATFDDANCRVFSFNGNPRRLEELAEERRSGQHKPEFEDRQGRVYSSASDRRSGMVPRTDPERKIEVAFVQGIAAHLAARAETGAFDRLIVAAGPRALGDFRAAAPKALTEKVSREINGNYVNAGQDRLLQALEE